MIPRSVRLAKILGPPNDDPAADDQLLSRIDEIVGLLVDLLKKLWRALEDEILFGFIDFLAISC